MAIQISFTIWVQQEVNIIWIWLVCSNPQTFWMKMASKIYTFTLWALTNTKIVFLNFKKNSINLQNNQPHRPLPKL